MAGISGKGTTSSTKKIVSGSSNSAVTVNPNATIVRSPSASATDARKTTHYTSMPGVQAGTVSVNDSGLGLHKTETTPYVPPTTEETTDTSSDDNNFANAYADYYKNYLSDLENQRNAKNATLDTIYNRYKDSYVASNEKNKKQYSKVMWRNGQNPSQSKLWDMDYALDKNLFDLEQSKNQAKETNNDSYLSSKNSAISSLLGSGLETSKLYKVLKDLM